MDQRFKDKSAKVVVVDTSGAARTLLLEVVRNLGFSEVSGVPSIKDALGIMEVEQVHWLITPLMGEQPENALHVLKIFTQVQILRNLRISLLLEDGEEKILPTAFEYGLLSYHSKPYTKDTLTDQFKDLTERFEAYDYEATVVAASYLRPHLVAREDYSNLLGLEKRLTEIYPGRTDLLFNLLEPLVKLGRETEGKAVLARIKLLYPDDQAKVAEYAEKYFSGQDLEQPDETINYLELDTVAIVDADEAIVKNVTDVLQGLGVNNIHGFENADLAMKFMQDHPVDLIIMEWRIFGIPGPIFIQRVREVDGAKSAPIVVVSSLIEEQDIPTLKELGVAHLIRKPFDQSSLMRGLVYTVQQDRMPTEKLSMERKMRILIREKKLPEAAEIKTRYIENGHIPIGAKQSIEAEFAYAQKDYDRAREFGIEAIKNSADSIFVLNLMGKVLMNLREYDIALKCFKKAQTISPLNLERLCSIAECHSEMGDQEQAQEALEEAKKIDMDSERTKETAAGIALNSGDTAFAKKIMNELNAVENVVSYMNNQAVAMARCEMVAEGIEQYQRTLEAIPDKREDIRGIVLYNIALAYARNNDLEVALGHLNDSLQVKNNRVKARAKSLKKRIERSLETGHPLNLKVTNDDDAEGDKGKEKTAEEAKEVESVNMNLITAVESKPGDMVCYMVFRNLEPDEEVLGMMQSEPRFNPREVIEREESRGADKMMHGG